MASVRPTTEAVVRRSTEEPAVSAAAEAEGDGSLASWREGHRRYFTRECEQWGLVFSEHMPVLCERFEVVHRPPASDTLGG